MANPYKTAEEKKKKAPGGTRKPQDEAQASEVVTTPVEPEKLQEAVAEPVAEPVSEPVAEKPAEEPPAAPVRSLLEDLIPQKKPEADTYGFYLDNDVHAEILRLAKKNKTSKSKYLNALLRRVLFDE